jgi:hypothetical protein
VTAQGITGPPIPVSDVVGLQATLTDLQDQIDDIDGGGGGGGTPIAIVAGRVSTGNVTPQNTSAAVQLLTGGPTFSIAAAAGDRIEADVNYLTARNGGTFYDLAVIVGGVAVRYCTTGTSTPPVEGDPAMYPDQPAYQGRPGPFRFTAEAGDISGGNVTIGFVVLSQGNGLLYANTAFPMRYALTNYGEAP